VLLEDVSILFMHMSLDGYVAAADRHSDLIPAADDNSDDHGEMETVVPKPCHRRIRCP